MDREEVESDCFGVSPVGNVASRIGLALTVLMTGAAGQARADLLVQTGSLSNYNYQHGYDDVRGFDTPGYYYNNTVAVNPGGLTVDNPGPQVFTNRFTDASSSNSGTVIASSSLSFDLASSSSNTFVGFGLGINYSDITNFETLNVSSFMVTDTQTYNVSLSSFVSSPVGIDYPDGLAWTHGSLYDATGGTSLGSFDDRVSPGGVETYSNTFAAQLTLIAGHRYEAYFQTYTFSERIAHDGQTLDESASLAFSLSPSVVLSAVPEPSSIILAGIGGLVCLGYGRRRKAKLAA
jgi:hypothetical protein